MSSIVINAMIPARAGSERLKFKNLRLLRGKPVISYAIEAAKTSGVFDSVRVNSEHPIFETLAKRHDVGFHLRPIALGSSEARSDDVVADFMRAVPGDILVWVNPIAPLQPAEEIRQVVEHFAASDLDTLITVKQEQVHCLYQDKPINFSLEGLFAKTQDLIPVQAMVYSLMMWRYDSFLPFYERHGYALMSGKVGYYAVQPRSCLILKYENDLQMMAALLEAEANGGESGYDPLVDQALAMKSPNGEEN